MYPRLVKQLTPRNLAQFHASTPHSKRSKPLALPPGQGSRKRRMRHRKAARIRAHAINVFPIKLGDFVTIKDGHYRPDWDSQFFRVAAIYLPVWPGDPGSVEGDLHLHCLEDLDL